MPYQPAVSLGNATNLAPSNCWYAHEDPAENLKAVLQTLRDGFFGALDPSDPEQALLFRWMVILQYDIDLTSNLGTASRTDDAWRVSRSVSQMYRAAALAELESRITPALATELLNAYNAAFS